MTQANNWEVPSHFEPQQTLLLNETSNILIEPEMLHLNANENNVFDHSLHSKVVVMPSQKRAKSATQSKQRSAMARINALRVNRESNATLAREM